jgi:hypothetical protein
MGVSPPAGEAKGRGATAGEALAFASAIRQQASLVNQQPSNSIMVHRSMKENDGT